MNAKEVDALLEKPKLYYNIDGVRELGAGFICLGFALLGWLQMHAPRNSVWHEMWPCGIYAVVMAVVIHFGSKAIKNRITYPRTGFVDYGPRRKHSMAIGGAVSVLVSAGVVLASRRHWDLSAPVSLVGLAFAASYVRFAMAVRWKWAAFWAIVAGSLTIAALPADLVEAFAGHSGLSSISARAMGTFWLTFIVYGAVLMISGGISFWLYLRHTQPAGGQL